MSEKSGNIKQMADLLKQGATLTELACPACASPLFRYKSGDLWCARCEKRVVVVKESDEVEKVTGQAHLAALENTILTKIEAIEKRISEEENVEELQKLSVVLASLLENLEKLKEMKT